MQTAVTETLFTDNTDVILQQCTNLSIELWMSLRSAWTCIPIGLSCGTINNRLAPDLLYHGVPSILLTTIT